MPKLLVVTPPGPNADALVTKLGSSGYDVTTSPNGSEAISTALSLAPDAILMDSALSAMDRWHAVKRLNSEPRTSRIPVLTLSSDSTSPGGLQRVIGKLQQTVGVTTGASQSAMPSSAASQRTASVRPTVAPGMVPPVRSQVLPAGPGGRATPPAAPARTTQPAVADDLDSARILVVDDNDLNRDMLSRRLRRRGYDVHTSEDGHKALAAIAELTFDLVLLDWMMPGLSGIEVLKRIRDSHTSTELPVIMATAKTEAEDIVEALRLDANDYVTKPLNFDVVHARIRTQLGLVRAHKELRVREQQYRALLENTGDMIVRFNLDGGVQYVSPASNTLLGASPDELQQKSFFDWIHPVDRREFGRRLTQPSTLPSAFTFIARMERSDGSWIWVETSCRVLRDGRTGSVQGIQSACRDVTEHMERLQGDEPPLPLGGDIMAHPGWRGGQTPGPAPERSSRPVAAPKSTKQPVIVVGLVDGLDLSTVDEQADREKLAKQLGAQLLAQLERGNG